MVIPLSPDKQEWNNVEQNSQIKYDVNNQNDEFLPLNKKSRIVSKTLQDEVEACRIRNSKIRI